MVYSEAPDGPTSSDVRSRVIAARDRQHARAENHNEPNGRLSPRSLRDVAALSSEAKALLSTAADRMGLSARAMTRVLRVARTIADLEEEQRVSMNHIAEAIGYRSFSGG
jgi:magnesium chelatase family protein